MDKQQHNVQNAAALLLTGTRKYERGLSRLMHDDQHWPLAGYSSASAVRACCDSPSLSSVPSRYLADYCVPVSEVSGHQHLRSARCHQLSVPRVRRTTLGTRAFSVAGPTLWNSLPDHLRDPDVDSEQFRRDLKTHLFAENS